MPQKQTKLASAETRNRKSATYLPSAQAANKQDRSVEKILLRLYEKKYISEIEWRAAMSYVADFAKAKMQGHYARVHYEDIGMGGTQTNHANDNYNPSEQIAAARLRMYHRDQALGRTAAEILYYVLGLGMSLQDYTHRLSNGGYSGTRRCINPTQANGLLLAAIARLAEI